MTKITFNKQELEQFIKDVSRRTINRDYEQDILDMFLTNKSLSRSDVKEKLRASENNLCRALNELVRKKLLTRIVEGRKVMYSLAV